MVWLKQVYPSAPEEHRCGSAGQPVSGAAVFSEGDATVSKTPEELLREILSTKPAVMDFSEKPAG
jgi:hypothetical protein